MRKTKHLLLVVAAVLVSAFLLTGCDEWGWTQKAGHRSITCWGELVNGKHVTHCEPIDVMRGYKTPTPG